VTRPLPSPARRRARSLTPRAAALAACVALLLPVRAAAQAQAPAPAPRAAATPAPPAPLYRDTGVLAITIRGDLRHLFRDRDSLTAPWREGRIVVAGAGGAAADTVAVRMRTRGIYRLANCDIPPIRLRFREKDVRGTPFDSVGRPKLVSVCHNADDFEQYLLQEYAIYRAYQLFTPLSFAVRLLRVTYEDTTRGARPFTRYAFVSEDPPRFAERMGGTMVNETGVGFRRIQRANIMLVSLFQYFIGNTDWAVPHLHNIALLRTDSLYAIPFDFDWSGAVEAPYAVPNTHILHIQRVRDRQYRGICAMTEEVYARFEALKDSIAAVYRAVPGIDAHGAERTLRYYDDFYRSIADRQRFEDHAIAPDCGW